MANVNLATLFICCWFSLCSDVYAQSSQCGLTRENVNLFPPTDFAFDMYRKTTELTGGNVFFSPVSISLAAGMLFQGAWGETASEIRDIFFPSLRTGDAVVPAYSNLMSFIYRENKPYALDTANAIYTRAGRNVLDSKFRNTVNECFWSEIDLMPFRKRPEDCRMRINKWVEEKTHNLIKDFLPPGSITASTEMMIVNAIYFKSAWLENFDPDATEKVQFRGLNGDVEMDMMHERGKEFNFYEDKQDGFKVLELPYKGEELSMIIFLPDKSWEYETFGSFEMSMSGDKMRNAMNNMYSQELDTVAIPKFKIEYELPLKKVIQSMGINTMFDARNADFSGITGTKGPYVSGAIHKAVIEVDEFGSKAAAATSFVLDGMAFPPEEKTNFIADSPFLYMIVLKAQQSVLFLGRFVNQDRTEAVHVPLSD